MQIAVLALAVVAFMAFVPFKYNPTWHAFVWATGSAPDQYGQQIYEVIIYQNISGSYIQAQTIMASNQGGGNYSSGMTLSITSNVQTYFYVAVLMNSTLITGSPSADTRVYLNVTGIYTNALMIYNSYSGNYPSAPFDDVVYEYPSTYWTPAASTTYSISLLYQAYY